jgi:hypothetical protein
MPIKDTRMISRAVMQRWPIKPEYRSGLIAKLMQVIANPNSSAREVTAAAKALIAAEKQNRKCYGMEISPVYCDVIVQRWEKLTGKESKLEKPGKRAKP